MAKEIKTLSGSNFLKNLKGSKVEHERKSMTEAMQSYKDDTKGLNTYQKEITGRLNALRHYDGISFKDLLIDDTMFQNRCDKNPLFEEIKNSIEKDGLTYPIAVRPKGNKYQIIFGFTRARAHIELKKDVEVFVYEGISDDDCKLLAYIENAKKGNLTLKDMIAIIEDLRKSGKTNAQIVGILDKSERSIQNYLRITENKELAALVNSQKITLKYAIDLLSGDEAEMKRIIKDSTQNAKQEKKSGGEVKTVTKPFKAFDFNKKTGRFKVAALTGSLEEIDKTIDALKEVLEKLKNLKSSK
jgi:ParB/RepB/Spo0J family partition protein